MGLFGIRSGDTFSWDLQSLLQGLPFCPKIPRIVRFPSIPRGPRPPHLQVPRSELVGQSHGSQALCHCQGRLCGRPGPGRVVHWHSGQGHGAWGRGWSAVVAGTAMRTETGNLKLESRHCNFHFEVRVLYDGSCQCQASAAARHVTDSVSAGPGPGPRPVPVLSPAWGMTIDKQFLHLRQRLLHLLTFLSN